jgi:hypothetical protein
MACAKFISSNLNRRRARVAIKCLGRPRPAHERREHDVGVQDVAAQTGSSPRSPRPARRASIDRTPSPWRHQARRAARRRAVPAAARTPGRWGRRRDASMAAQAPRLAGVLTRAFTTPAQMAPQQPRRHKKTPFERGFSVTRQERFELPTFGSVDRRSIQLSYWRRVTKSSGRWLRKTTGLAPRQASSKPHFGKLGDRVRRSWRHAWVVAGRLASCGSSHTPRTARLPYGEPAGRKARRGAARTVRKAPGKASPLG